MLWGGHDHVGQTPELAVGGRGLLREDVDVAPLCASGLGNPNTASVGPDGGQYLYLGSVGVADRHR